MYSAGAGPRRYTDQPPRSFGYKFPSTRYGIGGQPDLKYVRYAKPTSVSFVTSKQQGSFSHSNIRHGRTREVVVDRPRIVLAFDQSHKRTVVVPLPAIIWT